MARVDFSAESSKKSKSKPEATEKKAKAGASSKRTLILAGAFLVLTGVVAWQYLKGDAELIEEAGTATGGTNAPGAAPGQIELEHVPQPPPQGVGEEIRPS